MSDLQKELDKRKEELEEALEKVNEYLKTAPEGNLRCEKRGADCRYYLLTEEMREQKGRGRYLRLDEKDLIRELARKDYYLRLKPELEKEILKIGKFRLGSPEELYARINAGRRRLVEPLFSPAGEKIERRLRYYSERAEQGENTGKFRSKGGTAVSTASHKRIADCLESAGIFYVYGCTSDLKWQDEYVKPDFAVFNGRTGEEYFWEHIEITKAGKIPNKALKKLKAYEKNGVFTGEKLILTYSQGKMPDKQTVMHYIDIFLR